MPELAGLDALDRWRSNRMINRFRVSAAIFTNVGTLGVRVPNSQADT